MNQIKLEILEYSYWEHFKFGKELALIHPPEHPLRRMLSSILNEMLDEISILKHAS